MRRSIVLPVWRLRRRTFASPKELATCQKSCTHAGADHYPTDPGGVSECLVNPCYLLGGKHAYRIDPKTLPQALEQGGSDIFAPTATRTFTDPARFQPCAMGSSGLLRIAEALPQQELSESLYDWKFSQLWFALSCEDAAFGPQQATIELYKEYPRDGALLLIQRHVSILPRKNQVGWTEDELSPVLGHQPSIELAMVKVPVEQVLRIAEAQGGQAAREAVQNQCVIYLLLTASRAKNGWEVTYSGLPTQVICSRST